VTDQDDQYAFETAYYTVGIIGVRKKKLLDFARLIAAREREACAKLCEQQGDDPTGHSVNWRASAWNCAAAIRKRGES
jgi:hypothetical protein